LIRPTRFALLAFAQLVPAVTACSVLFPSNNIEPPAPTQQAHVVRVNSVGYLPERQKRATIVLPPGTSSLADSKAEVRDASTDAMVATCVVTGPTSDSATAATVYVADFTDFGTPGEYYIAVPSLTVGGGPATSTKFRIAADVYRDALVRGMLGLYGQRCGQAVTIRLDDKQWSHPACHMDDAYLDYLTFESKKKPSVGGWHDAGDYGKYITNGAFSAGTMLAAWEHFQPALQTLAIPALPETGGAIPDFLDEVKWQLDWLLTTQLEDGGVPHKLTALDFEGFVMPQEDGARRYFTPVGTAATGDFVAVMAQAARMYMPYDAAAATKYLAAARLGYTYLGAHTGPAVPDTDAFTTGGYGQGSDASNRLWAAAELWETTGEAAFLADVETRIGVPSVDANFDWANPQNLGLFTYLLSKRDGRNPTLVAGLTTAATTVANRLSDTAHASAFGRDITGYWWGSNGAVARSAMNLWVAHRLAPDPKYLDAIAMQLDHLLGRNIYDRTQVTGVGYNPPLNPHHRPSSADGFTPPWPGLLVGGANPNATSWKDDINAYEVNEVAINWSAAFVYATAALTPAP
jgi:endoglucanase